MQVPWDLPLKKFLEERAARVDAFQPKKGKKALLLCPI
jgi:hypothetical protein